MDGKTNIRTYIDTSSEARYSLLKPKKEGMNNDVKKATIWVAIAVAGKLAYDGIKAAVVAGGTYVAMKRAERKAKKAAEKEAAEKKED